MAIDGKTICGSKSIPENKKPVHIVSAWAAENGLVLGEVAVSEKSNEITAIPALLKMLELTGCIVTIDAMGTQKEIAKGIREAKAEYKSRVGGKMKKYFGEKSTLADCKPRLIYGFYEYLREDGDGEQTVLH